MEDTFEEWVPSPMERSTLNAQQRAAAQLIAFKAPSTQKQDIAKIVGVDPRSLRRWEAEEEFQAEVQRCREHATPLSADEAMVRLSPQERKKLIDRIRKTPEEVGPDIDDELASIWQKAEEFWTTFSKGSSGLLDRKEELMFDAIHRIDFVSRRMRSLVDGSDPNKEITLEEIKARIDQALMLQEEADRMRAAGEL